MLQIADKDKTINFRISSDEYERLKTLYYSFLECTYSNISFSEFIRRLLLGAKIEV